MGCDGGSIPLRADMVRVKKKKGIVDRDVELDIKWKKCALTGEPLREPVVSCELGQLYNKESVLEMLLSKSKPDVAAHIRTMKDIVELQLTSKSRVHTVVAAKAETYVDVYDAEFVCPVVGIEMSGRHKFVYLAKCGCVMSERAMREVSGSQCHRCNKEFETEDIRTINPDKEEANEIRSRMEAKRHAEKEAKLARKAAKRKAEEESTATSTDSGAAAASEEPAAKKAKSEKKLEKSGEGSSREAKIVLTGGSRNARSVAEAAVTGLVSAKQFKTVAEDPSASRVYKSLFTSSQKTAEDPTKPRGNWVVFPAYHL